MAREKRDTAGAGWARVCAPNVFSSLLQAFATRFRAGRGARTWPHPRGRLKTLGYRPPPGQKLSQWSANSNSKVSWEARGAHPMEWGYSHSGG